ncbi:MAG TPA: hypothetical protein VFI25_13915 [Planctomycetota bacterium]|nr:hypothetical protein [Planctomycetota bacterium]
MFALPSHRPIRNRRVLLATTAAAGLVAGARSQGYPAWETSGSTASAGLGTSVAATGDVDGDGLTDLLAGAPGDAPFGQAYVLSGANGAPLFSLAGTLANFGAAAAGVGDTDGDGVRDLLVGEPYAANGAGRATLFSGASGLPRLAFSGSGAGEQLGASVAGVGDQNGDGYADVLIGRPGGSPPYPGQATVYSGLDGSVLLTLLGVWGGEQFGRAVSEVGDVDGDGIPEVIVGAPYAILPGPVVVAGQARVFSGGSGTLLYTVSGGGVSDLFGSSVAGPLDASGDGVPDFLVGAPQGPSFLGFAVGPGYAVLYSGANAAPLLTLAGSTTGERFGKSVAWTGDVDGDGLSDLAVAAPAADSSAGYVAGRMTVFSGTSGAPLLDFRGDQAWALAGWGTTGVGDATGDGVPDLALGSPLWDTPLLSDAGRVTLLSAVGLPAASTPVGSGCAGGGGFAPGIATFGGPPAPGNADFGISLARGLGGSLAFLFAATASDPVGASIGGCGVHLAGSILFLPPAVLLPGPPGVPGAGYRLRGMAVPPVPTLVGLVVPFEWAVADGGSPNGLFTTTAALAVTIL